MNSKKKNIKKIRNPVVFYFLLSEYLTMIFQIEICI